MIKNNFRILKKQYAYLQTILKTPVKFQKDWPKTVGGVADTRMVVGADGRTDGQTDGRTDTQNFGGYNIIPRHFLVAGHNEKKKDNKQCLSDTPCWSMKKTNIKNTNVKMAKLFNPKNFFWHDTSSRTCSIYLYC